MEQSLNKCNLKFLQKFCKFLEISPYGVNCDVIARIAMHLSVAKNPESINVPSTSAGSSRKRFGLFKPRTQNLSLPNLTIVEEQHEEAQVESAPKIASSSTLATLTEESPVSNASESKSTAENRFKVINFRLLNFLHVYYTFLQIINLHCSFFFVSVISTYYPISICSNANDD